MGTLLLPRGCWVPALGRRVGASRRWKPARQDEAHACAGTHKLWLLAPSETVVWAPLGPPFCPHCNMGPLERKLNGTCWHRVFLCLFPPRKKIDLMFKLGGRARMRPIQVAFKVQLSFRGYKARTFEAVPRFPLFSGGEGKKRVAWVTGSCPSMNLTVAVRN